MKTIFIGSDHAGFSLKKAIIRKFSKKNKFKDLGCYNSMKSVNYPDYAHKVCSKVIKKKSSIGVLICGSGMGMAMAANKSKKIRAALCYSVKNAKLSRLHNDANVITLGSRLTNKRIAFNCLNAFLSTKFEGGRHKKRVKRIW